MLRGLNPLGRFLLERVHDPQLRTDLHRVHNPEG